MLKKRYLTKIYYKTRNVYILFQLPFSPYGQLLRLTYHNFYIQRDKYINYFFLSQIYRLNSKVCAHIQFITLAADPFGSPGLFI